jgi:hypothetical protein
VTAFSYDLQSDYGADPDHVDIVPYWVIAVIRLGRPVSYNRHTHKSEGDIKEGAFTRKAEPLLLVDDVFRLQISDAKRSHVKTMTAQLRGELNLLSADSPQPGDWMLAWIVQGSDKLAALLPRIKKLDACNGWADGLKFVGRVHDVFKDFQTAPQGGQKSSTYTLQGLGFAELDSEFFYDVNLATAAAVSGDLSKFLAQIGFDFRDWSGIDGAGDAKNNSGQLISTLIDVVLGKGVSSTVNQPTDDITAGTDTVDNLGTPVKPQLSLAPQATKEAPFAYLVPRAVGQLLGRDPSLASKGDGIFGYADIMETLIGVQQYAGHYHPDNLDLELSTSSRKVTDDALQGTYLPTQPSFANRPLWSYLQIFLNGEINEMYTSLRINEAGRVVPTLVVRQIPFSTEAAEEPKDMLLTRFMSLPRWKLPLTIVKGGRVGRSDSTRCNMMHVYGVAELGAANRSVTAQMVTNPPIFDLVDIMRSGIRGHMSTVNCTITDELKAPRGWMEALADFRFNSHLTLGGQIRAWGLQPPIPVGDNLEFDGVVYHIEALDHEVVLDRDGRRSWSTTITVSNGMPADQDGVDAFPRYPGFAARAEDDEDGGADDDPASAPDNSIHRDLDPGPGGASIKDP